MVALIDRGPICPHADFGFTVGLSLMATTITHRVLVSDAARRRLTGFPTLSDFASNRSFSGYIQFAAQ